MEFETEPNSDRKQTDESLRVECEKADHALGQALAAIDETADAVISRARARAHEVLAAARAKTDHQLAIANRAPRTPAFEAANRERVQEDHILLRERASADETLREERAEHVALLSREHSDTDTDHAPHERARSDNALAMRDEFLGIVSHDRRKMLNAVGDCADLIAERVLRENNVDQGRMGATHIQQSATRMNRLVGDLVDVAGIRAGRLALTAEVEDVTQVVTEAVEAFLAQASASRTSVGDRNSPAVVRLRV